MHISDFKTKYILFFILILVSINASYASENLTIRVNYINIQNEKLFTLRNCLNKHKIHINEFKEIDKKYPYTMLDYKFNLYKYYKSSIEVYFYKKNHISYDTLIYYYTGINQQKFNKIFNKDDMYFYFAKNAYWINYHIKQDALIVLTPYQFVNKNGKRIRAPFTAETNNNYDAVMTISNCLAEE